MKRKSPARRTHLTLRLTAVSMVVLAAFTLLAGIMYNTLLREETVDYYSRVLQRNAYVISQNLYDLIAANEQETLDDTRMQVSWETLAPYLALTEQITRSNAYIVDTQHHITGYFQGIVQTLDNMLLPAYLQQSIALGFMGKTPFIRSGSGSDMRLTACAPVMDENSRVLGVVLLDTSLRELGYTQVSSGMLLMISVAVSFSIALLLALVLSRVFTSPIRRTERAAIALSAGQYETRLPVRGSDEVGHMAQAMNILAERLELARQRDLQQQKRQQQFFSTISHELRTPVTVLRGSVEALADGIVSEPEAIRQSYRQMIAETEWLQKLIADLLELSRLQDPDFAIGCAAVDLSQLLSDVAMSAATLCARKGVHLVCSEPQRSYTVSGDYGRLRQMLMVVVDNAVKFTPSGKRVFLKLDAEQPVITISDEGPGVPEAQRKRMFERFYHTTVGNADGTGLGLALAREIAQRHQIDLKVDSGSWGTSFCFLFHA